MKIEFEAKWYPLPASREEFTKNLELIGAKKVFCERLMKQVLYGKEVNPGIEGNYARIRNEGDKITASVKVHAEKEGNLSDQKEACMTVPSFEDAEALFKALGLQETDYQEKLRETWMHGDTHIEIDTWPGLETYVEIEGKSEQEVKNIADLLRLDWNEKHITSIVDIYMMEYGLTKEEVREKLRRITFEHCTF